MTTDNNELALRNEVPAIWQIQLTLSDHPIIKDEYGVLRYKQTDFKEYDWNRLWVDYQHGLHTLDTVMQTYRDTGTSLSHFSDSFEKELADMRLKQAIEEPIEIAYRFWNETKAVTWPELYEIMADTLATEEVSTSDLEEMIAILRCAAFRERVIIPEQYNQEPDHR